MDVAVGARVVTADGEHLGTVERREQDYFRVLPDDGDGYWLNFDTVEDNDDDAADGEVRLRIASDGVERYHVQPASAQSAQAAEADTLDPGPVGRLATAGPGGEEEFSSDLASDIAERRGTPEADVVPEQLQGRLRDRGAREGSEE